MDVVDRIRSSAEDTPNSVAFIGVNEGKETILSYQRLDRDARARAAWLAARHSPGDRILLLHNANEEFVRSFLACLYAGMIAVPAPSPDGQPHHLRRTTSIVRDSGAALVLTDAPHLDAVSEWLDSDALADLPRVATDATGFDQPEAWSRPTVDEDTVAFLQYTSGSVGDPKGVVVTYGNLSANLRIISERWQVTAASAVGGWLPMYHDMGLIGLLLLPMWTGSASVQMAPSAFLRRPHRWLEMVDKHNVRVTAAPNFAYDYCARRVTDAQLANLDLSRWRTAANGAEPVSAATLARFHERFAPVGFRRETFGICYGMAEATLFVCGTPVADRPVLRRVDADQLAHDVLSPSAAQDATTLVSSGQVIDTPEIQMIVVDPITRERVDDGRVGEVWIRGETVSSGYWRKDEVNAEVFNVSTVDGNGGWCRTGDLGAITGGELFVTGRLKEVLIVRGRNLYPQDVERDVSEIVDYLGAGRCAAFSLDLADDQVVVTQEIRGRGAAEQDLAGAATEIRLMLRNRFSVNKASVVFVRPGGVSLTSSGKIRRRWMRERFLAGDLEPVFVQLNPELRQRTLAAAAA
jgi:acyl-CoA synthetase (AMP-forming)/AMP-acid ligase II